MKSLGDYLDLTVEQARSQWGQILARQPKKRQEPFTPVEAILCYGLFYVVNPHRYGGSSLHRAPQIVHDLAALFVRPPGSITNKMMNLDGSRAHAGKHEWQFFIEMSRGGNGFPQLYSRSYISECCSRRVTWALVLPTCPTLFQLRGTSIFSAKRNCQSERSRQL